MSEITSRAAGTMIAKVGTSIIEKLAGAAAKAIKDRLTEVDLWSEYERKYIERYGKVKLTLSGMREAVPLEQIYTGVRFLDGLSRGQFASIEALEKGFRENPRQFGQQGCLPQDGMEVANQHSLLMVLGGPGAGKSTYLRRVGLEALRIKESQFQHECIPVMLELKRFDGEQIDIRASIAEEFSHVGFDFSTEFVEEALKQGKLLILLDGLDEVPKANQDRVHQAIQNFVSRYSQKHQSNRFIASCRIAAFRSGVTGFMDIQLADFGDKQIQQFIENWFQSALDQANKTAEKCWNLLNSGSYASAKELAQTPLLLTFLCVVYDRTQSFPANRATLYRKALDILLEEWAAEKRIRHEPIYDGLNTELEKVLLAEIAYQGFVEDQLFFTQTELINHIQKFLEDSADKPKYLDGKSVLNAIVAQQGILSERTEDIYSFSHLTVQEYLTAQYLSQTQTALTMAVNQYLLKQRWREVFLLASGLLLPNSDYFLKWIAKENHKKASSIKLQKLFIWSNQVTTTSEALIAPLNKRVISLFFLFARTRSRVFNLSLNFNFGLLSDLSLALNLVNDLACNHSRANILDLNFPIDLAHALELDLALAHSLVDAYVHHLDNILNESVDLLSLISELESLRCRVPSNKQPLEIRRAFADQLLQIWCCNLNLEQELLIFSKNEIQLLADYLYICELMIRCKDSAVRVSLEVWESIENAMIMPTPDSSL